MKLKFRNHRSPGFHRRCPPSYRLGPRRGPAPRDFDAQLAAARWTVVGFQLRRSRTIPDLDAPCGRYLTYRQLIACGETQASTQVPNLLREPDSYTARHDLAVHVLDPVIEYFGMIGLTYGCGSLFYDAGWPKITTL